MIKESSNRKLEQGTLVAVVLAIIAFAFWLGGLETKINKLDPDTAAAKTEEKITDAAKRAGTIPKGTIVAWYSKIGPIPTGWGLCDGNDGRPNLNGRFLR